MALDVRGGGGGSSEEASVMTLFIRVLVPGFGREKNKDEELDLEGGGLLRRLKRLVSGVLRTVRGSSAKAETEGKQFADPKPACNCGSEYPHSAQASTQFPLAVMCEVRVHK